MNKTIYERQIADLEAELRRQVARAERAEAELKRAREQEPFGYISQYQKTCMALGDSSHAVIYRELHPDGDDDGIALFTLPVPAPAVTVPAVPESFQIAAQNLIDAAGTETCSPTRCQYPMDCCKMDLIGAMDAMSDLLQSATLPVAYGIDDEAARRIALVVHDYQNKISDEPLLYAINRILIKEVHPLSADGLAEVQSATQAAISQKLPPGWTITRCDDNSLIVSHGEKGSVVVSRKPEDARMIPEAVLFALAEDLLGDA